MLSIGYHWFFKKSLTSLRARQESHPRWRDAKSCVRSILRRSPDETNLHRREVSACPELALRISAGRRARKFRTASRRAASRQSSNYRADSESALAFVLGRTRPSRKGQDSLRCYRMGRTFV